MKVYEVASGWMGCSYERAYVIANDPDEALQLAIQQFQLKRKNEYKNATISGEMELIHGTCSEPSDEGLE